MNRAFQRKYFVDYLFSAGGLFLLILFTGKFFYLKELSLPLSYDESYYWDWSRHLDWGYYSKPPMVAWLIYLSTKAFGINEFAVRLPALLSITGAITLLYVSVFRYFGEYLARAHLFVLSFVPIFFAYSFVMTIDPPLLFFWALSLYFLIEYLKRPSYLFGLLTGLSMGFSLLTKQTALMLPLLTLFYLFFFERKILKLKTTFLIFFTAFLLYLPNLYWNFKHGFVLLMHTQEHFKRGIPGLFYYVKFYSSLFALFGPVFFGYFLWYGFKYLKFLRLLKSGSFEKLQEDEAFKLKVLTLFYVFSFLPVLPLLILALFKEFNPNWIMPFFLSGYLWVLYFLLQKKQTKLLYVLNLLITLSLCLLLLFLPRNPGLFGKASGLLFYKFLGWKELASMVEKHYTGELPILCSHREIASSLAFYMKAHPEVYVVNLEKRPENQYHLWRKDEELLGREVLFVQKGDFEPRHLLNAVKLDAIKMNFWGKEKSYSLWKGMYVKVLER